MNPAMPQDEDDGFNDFRAQVKGLPPEQRRMKLKEMEDAVLENLRSNMLADLYAEDQPTPAPKAPAPRASTQDPNSGSYMYGSGTAEDDATWRQRAKEAEATQMGGKPPVVGSAPPAKPMSGSIIDEPEPEAFADVATPTKYQEKPMSPGAMGARDAATARAAEEKDLLPWAKREEMIAERARKRGEPEPPQEEGYGPNPDWLMWAYKDAAPQEVESALNDSAWWMDEIDNGITDAFGASRTQYLTLQALKQGITPPTMDEMWSDNWKSDPEMKSFFNRARPPAPNARSGMFARPPGISANRKMIDE